MKVVNCLDELKAMYNHSDSDLYRNSFFNFFLLFICFFRRYSSFPLVCYINTNTPRFIYIGNIKQKKIATWCCNYEGGILRRSTALSKKRLLYLREGDRYFHIQYSAVTSLYIKIYCIHVQEHEHNVLNKFFSIYRFFVTICDNARYFFLILLFVLHILYLTFPLLNYLFYMEDTLLCSFCCLFC